MGYWAEAPLPRDQILLIPVTLGDRIPVDHPVRLFDEILSSLDWSKWENHYCRVAGQPAIPPRVVAGAILYGLSHGLRSSRRLEWACGNAVDFMWLVEGTKTHEDNPAPRADPTQPVPQSDWPKLPRRPQTHKLDRSAFIYDSQKDCYWCPMGRKLEWVQTKEKGRLTGEDSIYEVYRCRECEGCGLAKDCLAGSAKSRMVSRDQHEGVREAAVARLSTEEGRETYGRRSWIAETPYALIKAVMGLRQFLLRGLDKVRTEWRWACTAYNLQKLVRVVAALRAQRAMPTS